MESSGMPGPKFACDRPRLYSPTYSRRIGRTCHSLIGIMKSKHSRRMVPITRSQKAFACRARTGVFRILRPIASSVPSTRLQPSVSRQKQTGSPTNLSSRPSDAGHRLPCRRVRRTKGAYVEQGDEGMHHQLQLPDRRASLRHGFSGDVV